MKDWRGCDSTLVDVVTRDFPGGTEENNGKSVMIEGVLAEIRTQTHTNISVERYLLQ